MARKLDLNRVSKALKHILIVATLVLLLLGIYYIFLYTMKLGNGPTCVWGNNYNNYPFNSNCYKFYKDVAELKNYSIHSFILGTIPLTSFFVCKLLFHYFFPEIKNDQSKTFKS